MKILILMFIACIGVIWLIEYLWGLYLDSLPKDKRDEIIKRQSKMHCSNCGSTDFEVIGLRHGKVIWQCKRCKKQK